MGKGKIFLIIGLLVLSLGIFIVADDVFTSTSSSPDSDFSSQKIIDLKVIQQDNFEKYIILDIHKVNATRFEIKYKLNESLAKNISDCNLLGSTSKTTCFSDVKTKYLSDVKQTDFSTAIASLKTFPTTALTSNIVVDSRELDLTKEGVMYVDLLNYDEKNLAKSVGEQFKIGFNSITIETVESTNDVGWYSSLALDSNGIVHISYFDTTNDDLRYCNNSGGTWNCELIDSIGQVGYVSSIAIDSNNNIHITYYDDTNGYLKYCNNIQGWKCMIITGDDTTYGGYIDGADSSSIGIDKGNNINIFLTKYSTSVGKVWALFGNSSDIIPKGYSSYYENFYLEQNGTHFFIIEGGGYPNAEIHQYYINGTYNGISFSTYMSGTKLGATQNGTYLYTLLDSPGTQYSANGQYMIVEKYWINGTHISGIVNGTASGNTNPHGITNNNTHLFITDSTDDEVYIYLMNGTYVTSFDTATSGNGNPFGITQNGTYIWVVDNTDDEVYKYWLNGTYINSFDTNAVGNTNPVGITNNNTYIWVSDEVNDEVYVYLMNGTYVSKSDFNNNWNFTSVAVQDYASWSSIAIDSNNNSHAVYYDHTGTGDLVYCNNTAGLYTWSCSEPDNNANDLGNTPSIAIDSNNKIHIAEQDDTNDDLRYCTDLTGSWVCSTIDSTNSVGRYSSIAIDSNNNIHITHYDITNGAMRYCTDTSGSWVCSQLGLTDGNYLGYPDSHNLAIKKGRIVDTTSFSNKFHVSYYNNSDLYYLSQDLYSLSLIIQQPLNLSYLNYATNIPLNFTIANQTSMSSCLYSTDNYTTNTTITNCVNTTFNIAQGNYLLKLWINDSVGNVVENSTNFTVDITFPLISIISPANNTNSSNTGLDVNYSATDTNRDSCWYSNDTFTINTTLTNCANITSVTWSEGSHSVKIWANDSAGNTNVTQVSFTIDTIYPLIDYGLNTENNNTNFSRTWLYANVSVTETNEKNITFTLFNQTSQVNSTTYTTAIRSINWTTLPNEIYYYNVTICDIVNQCNSTQTRKLTLDTTNPLISFGGSVELNNTNFSRTWIYVNVSVTETNFKNITLYVYRSDGTVYGSYYVNTLLDGGRYYNFSATNGVYYYNAITFDQSSNSNSTETRWIRLDTNAPVITLYDPDPVIYSSNVSIPLNFTSVDTTLAVSKCWYKVTNLTTVILSNVSLTNCANSTFDVPRADTYNFTLWSNDTLGQTNLVEIQFEVDLTGPGISLDYPTDALNLSSGTNVQINFTATDSDGISQCKLYSNFTGTWGLNETFTSVTSGVTKSTTKNLSDNYYIWSVWCNDTSNNANWALNNMTFTIDTVYPLISYGTGIASNNSNLSQNWIFVNTSITDINFKNLTIYIYNNDSSLNTSQTFTDSTRSYNFTSMYGTFYYNTKVFDWASNSNSTSTMKITVDNVNPLISIIYPPNNTNSSDYGLNVNFSATDDYRSSCWWSDDGVTNNSNPTCLNLTGPWVAGVNNVTLWINDTSGNINSTSIVFIIDAVYPLVSVDSITTTIASQVISFNSSASDTYLKSCKFSIFNLAGGIDGIYENVSIACNTNPHSATVSGYATYNLTVYAIDYANNENKSTLQFTTSATSGVIVLPGGGSPDSTPAEDLGYCGDKVCNSARGETFYTCPDDCSKVGDIFKNINLDGILFNCIDNKSETKCFWTTNPGWITLFIVIGIFFLGSTLFKLEDTRKGTKKIVWIGKKKKR